MNRLTSGLVACGVFALALVTQGSLPAVAAADVTDNGRLTGSSPISTVVRPGCYYRMEVITLRAGTTYTIDLRSNDFDAYLVLADDTGRVLAQDDDSGGGLDARITFRAPHTGEYQIYVTTFSKGQRGNYTLQIRP